MKLSINICATAGYLYVWRSLLRRVVAAAKHRDDVHIVFISDKTEDCKKAYATLMKECPKEWEKEHRAMGLENKGEPYKNEQQILIAKMHGEAFAASRLVGADQCWTIEADILPPPDALRMMEWALQMPQADGTFYYDVAYCLYFNGQFMGGRGDLTHPIGEDHLPEERELPEELKGRYEEFIREEKELFAAKKMPDEERRKKAQEIGDEVKKCPPKGNVFHLNAVKWRPRGWFDMAYPAIGRGAIVPADWCGEGCNLLSKRALATAFYEGYDGGGTQDLFLCWRRYFPDNIRIAAIPHTLCDHIKKKDGKLIQYQGVHEQQGEAKGHLRVIQREWIEV